MPLLNQTTIAEFQKRFYSFYDSLIRKIEVSYGQKGERNVTVWVATRDAKETANDGWVCVRFLISRAQDFCFADAANTTAAVISNGVHIIWDGELVGVDFGHFIAPPESMSELKLSKCFAVGASVDWTVDLPPVLL